MNLAADGLSERQRAFESLSRAHEILWNFHQQLSAFFHLLDYQFGEDSSWKAVGGNNVHVLPNSMGNIASQQQWFPGWMGRSYIAATVPEGLNPFDYTGPGATELAFVWIVAWDKREPRLKNPECWLGIADHKNEQKSSAAATAVWSSNLDRPVLDGQVGKWVRGGLTGKDFGPGAFFEVLRVPLIELATEIDVSEKVSGPLRQKFKDVFGR